MPTSQLSFTGINRAVSDYATSGACEELINLRPTTGGLVPVKGWETMMTEPEYPKIYVHYANGVTNHIGLDANLDYITIDHISPSGSFIQSLASIPVTDFDDIDKVHVASTGNILLVSVCAPEYNLYINKAFLWNGSSYEEMTADAPDLDVTFTYGTAQIKFYNSTPYTVSDDYQEIDAIIRGGFNAIQEREKQMCFGATVIAVAYKTTDGKIFWTGQWFVIDPMKAIWEDNPRYGNHPYLQDGGTDLAEDFPNLFSRCDRALIAGIGGSTGSVIMLAGCPVTMNIARLTGWQEQGSILKSVEIYASRPQLLMDGVEILGDTKSVTGESNYTLYPEKTAEVMDLGGQLLYLQKSIDLTELAGRAQHIGLTFGGNEQMTGDTLDVDAGAVTRFGDLLAYNARFHFFGSAATTHISMPDFGMYANEDTEEDYNTCHVVAHYRIDGELRPLYLGTRDVPENITYAIAPTLGIEKIRVFYKESQNFKLKTLLMRPSTAYNYSICVKPESNWTTVYPSTSLWVTLNGYISQDVVSDVTVQEPSAINVTEQYSPFVFRVEHSYLAPGRVIDLQPQLVAVQDVSFGDYPLNVFTDRGTYALLQGNDNIPYGDFKSVSILYGKFKSISNLVSQGRAMSTDDGTFLLADGGLWVVAGSHATLVSDALSRGPHKEIRTSSGYASVMSHHYGQGNPVPVSTVEFAAFTQGATLAYNRYRDELMVCNGRYGYAYVLSLKYRQWFKIAGYFSQDTQGNDLIRSGDDICDMSVETGILGAVHLQSRPFSVGYQYSHVHRIVAMIHAAIPAGSGVTVALYGSDNLTDWTLLTYANRSGTTQGGLSVPLKVSQIRTPSAARSWRYYTVTITGEMPEDADLGPVLLDFQPVIRRIG